MEVPPDATPFDIALPPGIPYAPGLREWLVLLAMTVVTIAAVRLIERLRRRAPVSSAAAQATAELNELVRRYAQKADRSVLSRAAAVARRYLAVTANPRIATMAHAELTQTAAAAGASSLGDVLRGIAALELLCYAPAHAALASPRLLEEMQAALEKLIADPPAAPSPGGPV